MPNKNYGHIGIQSWLHIKELAEMVRTARQLGSTSSKPGQIVRQYIQAAIPLTNRILGLTPIDMQVEDILSFLRKAGVQSVQLQSTKLNTNILKSMVEESKDDADFKNWKSTITDTPNTEVEAIIKESMKNPTKLFDKD